MAALDVLQLVRSVEANGTSLTPTFSAVAAGDLLVFVVSVQTGSATITPPAGLTAYTNVNTEWPRLATYARVAQSGDATGWNFTISAASPFYIHAYRIEGPFTDLTGVTITGDASFSFNTSRKVLLSDATVAANTLVIATLSKYGSSAVSWDNSFANAVDDTANANSILSSSRRLYATSSSTVATTATWSGGVSGNSALIRVAAPSGGGPTAAAKARYRRIANITPF